MAIQQIDLNKPSDNGKQYYSIVIVTKNGHTMKTIKPNDGNYDILQFTNYSCDAVIENWLQEKYGFGNSRVWDNYKNFFHGTESNVNLDYIYKKYHKFFKEV